MPGSRMRWSGPQSRRAACGTISPTNPTSPLHETALAVTNEATRIAAALDAVDVHAERARLLLAEAQQVEPPGERVEEGEAGRERDRQRRERRPGRRLEVADQPEEDLLEPRVVGHRDDEQDERREEGVDDDAVRSIG
jgi:hypothetical protein